MSRMVNDNWHHLLKAHGVEWVSRRRGMIVPAGIMQFFLDSERHNKIREYRKRRIFPRRRLSVERYRGRRTPPRRRSSVKRRTPPRSKSSERRRKNREKEVRLRRQLEESKRNRHVKKPDPELSKKVDKFLEEIRCEQKPPPCMLGYFISTPQGHQWVECGEHHAEEKCPHYMPEFPQIYERRK